MWGRVKRLSFRLSWWPRNLLLCMIFLCNFVILLYKIHFLNLPDKIHWRLLKNRFLVPYLGDWSISLQRSGVLPLFNFPRRPIWLYGSESFVLPGLCSNKQGSLRFCHWKTYLGFLDFHLGIQVHWKFSFWHWKTAISWYLNFLDFLDQGKVFLLRKGVTQALAGSNVYK